MKTGILIIIIVILVLILGIQTGFLIKTQIDFKRKQAETDFFERPYAARVMPNIYAGWGQGSPVMFQRDIDTWDPFEEMEEMQSTMNRLFKQSFSRGLRSGSYNKRSSVYKADVDTSESEKEYVMKIDLPGIERDQIQVQVQNGQILVSGERYEERQQAVSQGNFHQSERSFGSFMRSVPLPADADVSGMTAVSSKGVLTITIPKSRPSGSSSKNISIR